VLIIPKVAELAPFRPVWQPVSECTLLPQRWLLTGCPPCSM